MDEEATTEQVGDEAPSVMGARPGGLSLPLFIMAFLLALIIDIGSLIFLALIALFGIGLVMVPIWRAITNPLMWLFMVAGGARGIAMILAAIGSFTTFSTPAVIGVWVKGTAVKEITKKLPAGGAIGTVAKAVAKA